MNLIYLVYLIFTLMISFLVVHYFEINPKLQWIPSASVFIFLGLISSLFSSLLFNDLAIFSYDIFFYFLLPPLIFNSSIDLDLDSFYRNITTIFIFANLGTLINALVVAIFVHAIGRSSFSSSISFEEALSFGALISATDPVTTVAIFQQLHVESNLLSIVVGVSALDDAVSVIMFNEFNSYQMDSFTITILFQSIAFLLFKFFGSILFGYSLGFVYYFILKQCTLLTQDNNSTLIALVTFLTIYLSFILAEYIYLSGIITCMFTAIAYKRYLLTYQKDIYDSNKLFIHTICYFFESISFVYIGFTIGHHVTFQALDLMFILWSNIACVIGRIIQIYPLSWLLNYYHHSNSKGELPVNQNNAKVNGMKLSLNYQHMMLFAGLRGPIAYATSQIFSDSGHHRTLIAFCTSLTVIITTLGLGSSTIPLLDYLQIPKGINNQLSQDNNHNRIEEISPTNSLDSNNYFIHHWLVRVETYVLSFLERPVSFSIELNSLLSPSSLSSSPSYLKISHSDDDDHEEHLKPIVSETFSPFSSSLQSKPSDYSQSSA